MDPSTTGAGKYFAEVIKKPLMTIINFIVPLTIISTCVAIVYAGVKHRAVGETTKQFIKRCTKKPKPKSKLKFILRSPNREPGISVE